MKKGLKLIILFIIFLMLNVLINNIIYKKYKKQIINNNISIVASFIEKYPELEKDIIESLLIKGNVATAEQLLNKYGLDTTQGLNYINEEKELKKDIYKYNFCFFIVTFSTLSFIYIYYIYNNKKKIKEINKYMNNILNENYNFDIRDYKEGDLSTLKNDIYKLVIKLKFMSESANQEKLYLEQVLSDISHQLKTPLTSMYVINDLLASDAVDEKVKEEFLIKNKQQLKRIEWLVSSLLKMSMLDSGSVVLKPNEIKVYDLIISSLEPLTIPIELKNQEINIIGDKKVTACLDYNWTVEALINIFKNAHEHTNEGGKITVEYIDNPLYLLIKAKDDGNGISKEDLPHIFTRFYKSQNSHKESVGIGLNMAKSIIEKQNGEIMVEETGVNGTTISIKFYKIII